MRCVALQGWHALSYSIRIMAQVKVAISKMPVPQKIQYVRQIISSMTGNPNFAAPCPALTVLEEGVDILEQAYKQAKQTRDLAKEQTTIANQKEVALDALVMQEANYVQNVTAGDKAKIESSGFGVRNTAAPIGPLPAPTNVRVVPSEFSGAVTMSWQSVHGARSYNVQRALDTGHDLEWNTVLSTSRANRVQVNSMASGMRYWFRVAAVGAAGEGPFSDPISKIAP